MSIRIEERSLGGIPFRIYKPAADIGGSLSIYFLLHGRGSNRDSVDWVARRLLQAGSDKKELWVITLDHRNHGARLVDPEANLSWKDGNPNHAVDMFAIYSGTSLDVSLLIELLPFYLFPNKEKTVESWGISGISLGGHAAWKLLGEDPRITIGIPIIGCPDYEKLMKDRATKSDITFGPPYIPDGFMKVVDPSNWKFEGKKILILSGAADKLVPWAASKDFVEKIDVGEGVKEVIVQEGVGHECTEEMVVAAVDFIGRAALGSV